MVGGCQQESRRDEVRFHLPVSLGGSSINGKRDKRDCRRAGIGGGGGKGGLKNWRLTRQPRSTGLQKMQTVGGDGDADTSRKHIPDSTSDKAGETPL